MLEVRPLTGIWGGSQFSPQQMVFRSGWLLSILSSLVLCPVPCSHSLGVLIPRFFGGHVKCRQVGQQQKILLVSVYFFNIVCIDRISKKTRICDLTPWRTIAITILAHFFPVFSLQEEGTTQVVYLLPLCDLQFYFLLFSLSISRVFSILAS